MRTVALPLAIVEKFAACAPMKSKTSAASCLTNSDVVTEGHRLILILSACRPTPRHSTRYFQNMWRLAKPPGRPGGRRSHRQGRNRDQNSANICAAVKLFPGTTIAPDRQPDSASGFETAMIASEPSERKIDSSFCQAPARNFRARSAAVAKGSIPTDASTACQHERVVVVADDSISVRKFRPDVMLEKKWLPCDSARRPGSR